MIISAYTRKALPICIVLALPMLPARASGSAGYHPLVLLGMQESGTGAPLGKLIVSPETMAGRCITRVSPNLPQGTGALNSYTVVVRAVIWKSGKVTPMHAVSGEPSLQAAAMDALRLWRYKPYARNGDLVDVTTDIRVDFSPGKPGGIITHPNH